MESSPPPYQPEASNGDDKEDLTPEQRAALEASLRPEALANERSAQMSLLSSLMDPTGEIAIKAKVKAQQQQQQQDEQQPSKAGEASAQHHPAPSSTGETAQGEKPAKTKARLLLEQRQAEQAAKARENGSSAASSWQPAQRYVPPSQQQQQQQQPPSSSSENEEGASVSQLQQSTPAKKDSEAGKSKSEKPVKMASLKDMFKPQEADSASLTSNDASAGAELCFPFPAGFSLADVLDEAELEEDDYDPFAAFKPAEPSDVAPAVSAYASYPSSRPSHAAPIRSGPLPKASEAPLFFPLCFDDKSDRVVQSLNLTEDQKARLEERSWTSGAGRRFVQLGSVCVHVFPSRAFGASLIQVLCNNACREDIAKHHEEMRPKLTEQVRKRHREAVRKVQRRKGGGGAA